MSSSWKKFSNHKRYSFLNVSASSKCEKGLLSLKREKMKIEKSGKQFKLDTKERKKGEKHGFKPMHDILKRKRLNARSYKKWLGLWATKREVSDLSLGRRDRLSQGGHNISEANGSKEIDERVIDVSFPDQKGKEVSHCSTAVSLCKDTESQTEMESDREQIACVLCMHGGELLCCYGQGCKKRFHLSCLDPPLSCVPPGFWYCIWCVKKKIECGVHSVSEGIDSILDARDVVSDLEGRQKQYLVKYKGLAHVHNLWIPEKQLLLETPSLVARYNKNQTLKWKSEWTVPQRLLQKRFLSFPEGCDGYTHEHDGNGGNSCYEWLVKWTGLSYDNATWELENAPFLRSPEGLKLVKDYATRHEKAKRATHLSKDNKQGKFSFSELSELPFGGSPGVQGAYLTYVNKLCEFWHGGQNAVVIDYQERVVKAILFILSVKEYTSRPFLVITPSTTISVWEAEFLRCVSSANIVVYKGNVDVRSSIRSLEFYNQSGCIMFHVLISSADVVVEDLEILKCIEWEAIIIDECQRRIMSVLVKQINMLAAKMKILLVSGQIKDRRHEYQNLLSFLDPGIDGINEETLDVDPNIDICSLKEKLAQFVAYECKSSSSKFVEYWVPVCLSNVQLEQYCASLLSNSTLLSSCWKNDSANTLHDILHLTRKCCDHPYLVDPSLQSFITRDHSEVGYLEIGIKVSGKLELLDKFLSEIKKRGLRVLIMFQALGVSGLISLGDILDDFVHQRFGKDSYARIGGGQIVPSKKQAAVNMFNDKESGKFVFLIENRACLPSIKLSSVDTVILFGSDWDPLDDLRALQKITIDSQFEQLKVFRLYSCCTVEEKLLMLTKQGVTLDSNIIRTRSTCHKLLTWGASYLFNKLDDYHDCNASVLWPNLSSEQSLLDNVLRELSALLPRSNQNTDHADCSIVLKVQQSEGVYPGDILLYGEMETQSIDNLSTMETEPTQCLKRPDVFWKNLLEDRRPRWKFLSEPPKRMRRNVQIFDQLPEESESVEDCMFNSTVNFTLPRSRSKNKRKLGARDKKDKLLGSSKHSSGYKSRVLPSSRYNMPNSNHLTESLVVPPAASDISGGMAIAVTLKRDTVRKVRLRKRAVTPSSREMDSSELTGSSSSTVQPHIFSLESHQLPASSNPPSAERSQVNVNVRIVDHQNNGNRATGQAIQVPRPPPIEDSSGLSNPPFVQPSINVPGCGSEVDASNLRSATTIQESWTNHYPQASPPTARMPQSACLDPLQMEMERIRQDEEKAFKLHEDTIMRLKDERDKEIDAIHKRYDSFLQDADIVLVQKRRDLDTYYKQVFMHKLLAEALTQKHNNSEAAGSRGTQQATISGFMNEILQLYFPQNGARTIPRLEQSSACLPTAGPPETTPIDQVANHSVAFPETSSRTTVRLEQSATTPPITVPPETTPIDQVANAFLETSPRTTAGLEQSAPTPPIAVPPVIKAVQVVSHPSELISTNLLSPCSNPMVHGRGSLFAGSEIRAPAPHLRRFRPPPPSVSSSNFPNIPIGVPSLESSSNPPVKYSMMPVQLTPDLHRCPSGSNNGIPQPENGGVPVMDGCLATPELPTSIIDSPAADPLYRSLPLANLDSTYCAI